MGTNPLTGPATEYIAAELRAEVARRSWTLDQAAEASGLPRSTVNRALKGQSALAVETFVALGLTLGMDVGAVLDAAALHAHAVKPPALEVDLAASKPDYDDKHP